LIPRDSSLAWCPPSCRLTSHTRLTLLDFFSEPLQRSRLFLLIHFLWSRRPARLLLRHGRKPRFGSSDPVFSHIRVAEHVQLQSWWIPGPFPHIVFLRPRAGHRLFRSPTPSQLPPPHDYNPCLPTPKADGAFQSPPESFVLFFYELRVMSFPPFFSALMLDFSAQGCFLPTKHPTSNRCFSSSGLVDATFHVLF